jgi:hypothetical protein
VRGTRTPGNKGRNTKLDTADFVDDNEQADGYADIRDKLVRRPQPVVRAVAAHVAGDVDPGEDEPQVEVDAVAVGPATANVATSWNCNDIERE